MSHIVHMELKVTDPELMVRAAETRLGIKLERAPVSSSSKRTRFVFQVKKSEEGTYDHQEYLDVANDGTVSTDDYWRANTNRILQAYGVETAVQSLTQMGYQPVVTQDAMGNFVVEGVSDDSIADTNVTETIQG